MQCRCHFRMVGTQGRLVDGQGALKHDSGRIEFTFVFRHQGQIVQGRGIIGMIGTQCSFLDAEHTSIHGTNRLQVPLSSHHRGQDSQCHGHLPMLGTVCDFDNVQGALQPACGRRLTSCCVEGKVDKKRVNRETRVYTNNDCVEENTKLMPTPAFFGNDRSAVSTRSKAPRSVRRCG